MYDKFVTKINATDISKFALKTQDNIDKLILEKVNDAE